MHWAKDVALAWVAAVVPVLSLAWDLPSICHGQGQKKLYCMSVVETGRVRRRGSLISRFHTHLPDSAPDGLRAKCRGTITYPSLSTF